MRKLPHEDYRRKCLTLTRHGKIKTWDDGSLPQSDSLKKCARMRMGASNGKAPSQTQVTGASMTARPTMRTDTRGSKRRDQSHPVFWFCTSVTIGRASTLITYSWVPTKTTRVTWFPRGGNAVHGQRLAKPMASRSSQMMLSARSGRPRSQVANSPQSSAWTNRLSRRFGAESLGGTSGSCEIAARRLSQDVLDFGESA